MSELLVRELEIDERGHHLEARIMARVVRDGLGRKAIEGSTEGAIPRPLLKLALGVEVAQ